MQLLIEVVPNEEKSLREIYYLIFDIFCYILILFYLYINIP